MSFQQFSSPHKGNNTKEQCEHTERQSLSQAEHANHQEYTHAYRSLPVLSELLEPIAVKHESQMKEAKGSHITLHQDVVLPEVEQPERERAEQ